MAVIVKLKGKKLWSSGDVPLNGTYGIYDYVSKQADKCSSLSIINYYSKSKPNEVSTTRFELVIGDSSNKDNYAVSTRIIAKKSGNKVMYSVEFLATEKGQYVLDNILYKLETSGYSKNGSDLYVMDKDTLLSVLKELFKQR